MTQTKVTLITLAVMIAILLLGAITIYLLSSQQEKRQLAASDAAGALSPKTTSEPFTDFAGNPANLDQYLGKVLVVNSWASWSPFSTAELKLLAEVADLYDQQEVVILAINRAEAESVAQSYLATLGIADQVKLIVDKQDSYYQKIAGYTMPETIFYDRKGNIVAHKRGQLSRDEALDFIEKALAVE